MGTKPIIKSREKLMGDSGSRKRIGVRRSREDRRDGWLIESLAPGFITMTSNVNRHFYCAAILFTLVRRRFRNSRPT